MADEGRHFPLGNLPRGYGFRGDSLLDLAGGPDPTRLHLHRSLPREDPDGSLGAILVEGIPASAGRLGEVLASLRARLREGGDLFFRLPNRRCWGRVQTHLHGLGVTFQPPGSLRDPLLEADREGLARDLWHSGLVTREIVAVPGMVGKVDPEVLGGLWKLDVEGAALEDEGGLECYYVHARREEPLAGSVIIAAAGFDGARETEDHLQDLLPTGWEVILSRPGADEVEPPGEAELWNRGFVRSRGDRLWFLRAGQRPPAGWLPAMLPVLFDRARLAVPPGEKDLAGLLLTRRDFLALGPLPWYRRSAQVTREEYLLHASRRGRGLEIAAQEIPGPEPPREGLAREAEDLVERYGYLGGASKVAEKRRCRARAPWGEGRPTVSLCMIARDEERFLPRCLEAVQGAVDEIIFLDTGSRDRTREIARSFGARVLEAEWRGDFAWARNLTLKEARGDWILVLDADEEISPRVREAMVAGVKDPTVLAYHLHFRNVTEEGVRTHGVRMTRLFRNLEGIEYERAIHEQVIHSLLRAAEGMDLRLAELEGEVLHYGYTGEVMAEKGKKERNWEIFEKQVEKDPEDFYNWYKFGDFMRRFGTPALVKEKLGRALEILLSLPESRLAEAPYAAEVATLIALEESREGNQERAEELLELAMDRFMRTPNTLYIAGGVAVRTGRPRLALDYYDQCLAFKDRVLVVPIEDGLVDYATWHAMGAAWASLGFARRGREYIEAALAKKPDYLPAVLGLTALCLDEGRAEEALKVLSWHLDRRPDSALAWEQGAGILLRLGLLDRARRWWERAREKGEGEHAAAKIGGEIAFLSGDREGACVLWKTLEPPSLREAALWVLAAAAGEARPGTLPAPETRVWVEGLGRLLKRLGRCGEADRLERALAGGPPCPVEAVP